MKHKILEQMEYPFTAYTDYPLLPREEGKIAPIRKISVTKYDGNKYCDVYYQGVLCVIKAGYIYPYPTNINEYTHSDIGAADVE